MEDFSQFYNHFMDETIPSGIENQLKSYVEAINDYSVDKVSIEITLTDEASLDAFLKELKEKTCFRKEMIVENKVLIECKPEIINLRRMIDLYIVQRYTVLPGTKEEKNETIKK